MPDHPKGPQEVREQLSPVEKLLRPLEIFAAHKLSGALLLLGATVVALLWANSPWQASYGRLFGAELSVRLFGFELAKPLLLWINDGLMAFFFFVVGLEIKREVIDGELATARES